MEGGKDANGDEKEIGWNPSLERDSTPHTSFALLPSLPHSLPSTIPPPLLLSSTLLLLLSQPTSTLLRVLRLAFKQAMISSVPTGMFSNL